MSARTYHHGDLPNALRRAASDVIVERGLGNFSLREVARRAGVSHTAPAHHFGDMQGLLTSLAAEGFELMAAAMEAALADVDDPVERLERLGQTYVEFAAAHAAHCDVMFRTDIVDADDADFQLAGLRAYTFLDGTVRALIDAARLDVDPDLATALFWSAAQGVVTLSSKLDAVCALSERAAFDRPDLLREFADLIVNGLRSRRT